MSKTSPRRRITRSFTLVELLVVLVIIGVLAGLILPSIWSVQRKARSAECMNNLRQIYTAMELYRNANDGLYPYAAIMPSLHLNNFPRLCDVLKPYAGNPNVFKCPADSKGYFANEGSSFDYTQRLAGQRVMQGRFAQMLGSTSIVVMWDYEDFHGSAGKPASRNFVYVDGHVGTAHGVPVSEDNSTSR